MTTTISRAAVLEILRTPAASDTFPDMIRRVEALEPVAQPETPIPGQFETMCLAIEDVISGRGFDVDPWQPIETAPKDGTLVLARYADIEDDRRQHWPGRIFVVKHMGYTAGQGYDMGWALFPGMGVGDESLSHWMPLPKPPGETTSAIPEEVKAYLRNALVVGGWRGERVAA